jgi:hypothetical protein
MKKLLILILPFLMVLYIVSCEEDFDINAPYQDITVVYGLIDQGQDSIFLKINKAFLGDGDVMEMAKIEDSSVYITDLNAFIEEWNGESLMRSYSLDTVTINNKEEGTFYNPYQIIYVTPFEPSQEREYRLKIEVNGRTITAKTGLVNDFSVEKPSEGSKFIQFNPDSPVPSEVKWYSAKFGRRYEVMMRINYKEVFLDQPDTVFKYIDWGMGTQKSTTLNGGQELKVTYNNNSFYTILADRVPYADPATEARVIERYTNNVDVIIAVAGEELNTYMEVNEPSNSIVQDKPDYTNITNGIGLFSSRYKKIRSKKIHPETIENIQTIDPQLKFVY